MTLFLRRTGAKAVSPLAALLWLLGSTLSFCMADEPSPDIVKDLAASGSVARALAAGGGRSEATVAPVATPAP